jgi:uncharacterized DUF497 family protein
MGPAKGRGKQKHGITFELAASVFKDPNAISIFDEDHGGTENRWITIGMAATAAILVVNHTFAAVREIIPGLRGKDKLHALLMIITEKRALLTKKTGDTTMKCFLWLLISGNVCMGLAFAQSSSTSEQMISKTYCEESFTRYSTGFSHSGIYVNPDGKLYKFHFMNEDRNKWKPLTNSKMTNTVTLTNLTEQKFENEYSHGRIFIRQIPLEEWQAKIKLLTEAVKGQMSEPKPGANGFGESLCRCFVFNKKDNKYQEIKLRVRGDWISDNSSPAAKEIAGWLGSITMEMMSSQPTTTTPRFPVARSQ